MGYQRANWPEYDEFGESNDVSNDADNDCDNDADNDPYGYGYNPDSNQWNGPPDLTKHKVDIFNGFEGNQPDPMIAELLEKIKTIKYPTVAEHKKLWDEEQAKKLAGEKVKSLMSDIISKDLESSKKIENEENIFSEEELDNMWREPETEVSEPVEVPKPIIEPIIPVSVEVPVIPEVIEPIIPKPVEVPKPIEIPTTVEIFEPNDLDFTGRIPREVVEFIYIKNPNQTKILHFLFSQRYVSWKQFKYRKVYGGEKEFYLPLKEFNKWFPISMKRKIEKLDEVKIIIPGFRYKFEGLNLIIHIPPLGYDGSNNYLAELSKQEYKLKNNTLLFLKQIQAGSRIIQTFNMDTLVKFRKLNDQRERQVKTKVKKELELFKEMGILKDVEYLDGGRQVKLTVWKEMKAGVGKSLKSQRKIKKEKEVEKPIERKGRSTFTITGKRCE